MQTMIEVKPVGPVLITVVGLELLLLLGQDYEQNNTSPWRFVFSLGAFGIAQYHWWLAIALHGFSGN
jgi:hypothetical protein